MLVMKYLTRNLQEMNEEIRREVLQLMQQKDKIEDDIKQLTSILTKNGVGMTDPLVDAEGFPSSNIDVYQVRNARHRIICLQNDHKAVMKQIENGLHGYYSSACAGNSQVDVNVDDTCRPAPVIHKTPFAKVTLVSLGSPSEYAGLRANDLVVEFGSVNSMNFKNVSDIGAIVQHSEGQHVNIKLQRAERYIVTQLLPKKWSGKGLLGCNIVPL